MSLLDFMPPRPTADVLAFPPSRITQGLYRVAVTHLGETTTYESPEDLAHAILCTPAVKARLARREAEAIRHAISRDRADRALAERTARDALRRDLRRLLLRGATVAIAAGAVAALCVWAVL